MERERRNIGKYGKYCTCAVSVIVKSSVHAFFCSTCVSHKPDLTKALT